MDYTLSEISLDLRASTPTKAALEVASISEEDIAHRLRFIRQRLHRIVRQRIQHQREIVGLIHLKPPQHLLISQRQRLEYIQQRIRQQVQHRLERQKQSLESLHHRLESLSPQHILQKGFSVVLKDGTVVTNEAQVKSGERLVIQLAEGTIEVEVLASVLPSSQATKPSSNQRSTSETQLPLFE